MMKKGAATVRERGAVEHVFFVNYWHFSGPSGIHIHFLANALEAMDISCTACVPRLPDNATTCGDPAYQSRTFTRTFMHALIHRKRLRSGRVILHAWTPRENVRRFTLLLARLIRAPYIVHLEDHEETILANYLGVDVGRTDRLSRQASSRIPPNMIHPPNHRIFLSKAAGVTCIIENLKNCIPEGVPSITFRPSCESEFFDLPMEPDREKRTKWGFQREDIVISYLGNVHRANAADVESLYTAIGLLNERGKRIRILRCGRDDVPFGPYAESVRKRYAVELGLRPAREMFEYVEAADLFVQPGKRCIFDDNRFPSKIPMSLAGGRPLILPDTNIGRELKDGEECLKLDDGSAEDIADKIERLAASPQLRRSIGAAGREFARKHFSWERSAHQVSAFYREILSGNGRGNVASDPL